MSSLKTNSQKKSTLNIGILAHVDAGKTSLTERLLFENYAISKLGSVKNGTTQTDTNYIEKKRGITIRSAVAPFLIGNLQINIVDTPGHPDFIAEVDRALSILDAAILIISAVEGIQAQTRVLMRSLKKMSIPTLIFINKVDRMSVQTDDLLNDIKTKLNISIFPMNKPIGTITPSVRKMPLNYEQLAELLSENDEHLLQQLIDETAPSDKELTTIFQKQISQAHIYPVYFGSALTGNGIGELTNGIKTLLPRNDDSNQIRIKGKVFAITRNKRGAKSAYVRIFSGQLMERQEVIFSRLEDNGIITKYSEEISKMEIIGEDLKKHRRKNKDKKKILTPGNIAKLKNISGIRVGDQLGIWDNALSEHNFSLPSLSVTVRPQQPDQEILLGLALKRLAEEDPLIQFKVNEDGALSILLYGAVQKEVIAERLRQDFDIDTIFEDIKPIYFERPIKVGEYLREFDPHDKNEQYWATIQLRIEPAEIGSGIKYIREAKWGAFPASFYRAIEETVYITLQQGLYGWSVTDCIVTLTKVGFNKPTSVAADFREITEIVLMEALTIAGTKIYEPYNDVEIEVPPDCVNKTIGYITKLGGEITRSLSIGAIWHIHADIPVRLVQNFTNELPELSQGEGVVVLYPGLNRPVRN